MGLFWIGTVFTLTGLVMSFTTAGGASVPTWLFFVGIGLLSLQQGFALHRLRRMEAEMNEIGRMVAEIRTQRAEGVLHKTESLEELTEPEAITAVPQTDEEVARSFGIEIENSPASPSPRRG